MLTFIFVLVGWLFSLCLHEYAHARVAYAGGDTTVEQKGYLSLNPLNYADVRYSLAMPIIFLLLGGIGLPGGAVYIERDRLRSKHWEAAVSLAGPAANIVLALVISLVLRAATLDDREIWPALAFLALLQVTAVVLNLLPVPPFDGYGVIAPYLPPMVRRKMDQAGRWAIFAVFIALWYVPAVNQVFWGLVLSVCGHLGVSPRLAFDGLALFRFWQHG